MRVASLFSGGKDSTYATYIAMQRGWDVTHLLSIVPEDRDSMLFHTPHLQLTPLQAEAMRIPLIRETATMGEAGELDAVAPHLRRVALAVSGVRGGGVSE